MNDPAEETTTLYVDTWRVTGKQPGVTVVARRLNTQWEVAVSVRGLAEKRVIISDTPAIHVTLLAVADKADTIAAKAFRLFDEWDEIGAWLSEACT